MDNILGSVRILARETCIVKVSILEPRREKPGFPNRSDTNRAAQLVNMFRGLKFWIYEVEGLYYPCSEKKDADQLRGYREADLRLCFRICKNPVFSRRGSVLTMHVSLASFLNDPKLLYLNGAKIVPPSSSF